MRKLLREKITNRDSWHNKFMYSFPLASTVTLLDLTGVAKHIISTTFRPIEVFIIAGGIYLFMTFVIHNFIKFLENKYKYEPTK